MRYCADTRLLEAMAAGDNDQKKWFLETLTNRPAIVVILPTICIAEFIKESLEKRSGDITFGAIDGFLRCSRPTGNLIVEGLRPQTAKLAGVLQHTFRCGISDAVVAATYFTHNCDALRSDHAPFGKIFRKIGKNKKQKIRLSW